MIPKSSPSGSQKRSAWLQSWLLTAASGCSLRKGAAETRAVQSHLPLRCIIALIHSRALAVQLSPVVDVEQFS